MKMTDAHEAGEDWKKMAEACSVQECHGGVTAEFSFSQTGAAELLGLGSEMTFRTLKGKKIKKKKR